MQLMFREQPDGEMDRPPTQRDQFNNDDVELADALVREALQNSLDAGKEALIRVRFALHDASEAEVALLGKYLDREQLRVRLKACSLMPSDLDLNKVRILTIEDFGTTGLTGSWKKWDNGAICVFWRRMGKSYYVGRSF